MTSDILWYQLIPHYYHFGYKAHFTQSFCSTKPISHVFTFDLPRLCKSQAGATTSDVIFPFVRTDAVVTLTERWYYTPVLDSPLTIA